MSPCESSRNWASNSRTRRRSISWSVTAPGGAFGLPVGARARDVSPAQIPLSDRGWNARGIGRQRVEDAVDMTALSRGLNRADLLAEPSLLCVINVNSPRRVDNELLAGL